jgi:hypothetical protein
MPRNPNHGSGIYPRADMTSKGEHPDLQDDALLSAQQRADRDWDQRYASDATFKANLERELGEKMRRWPRDIVGHLEGRTFAGTPSEGYRTFLEARRELARGSNTVFESDLNNLSPADYSRYIGDDGRPRQGYRLVLDKAEALSDKTPLSSFVIDRRHEVVPPAREDDAT